MNAAIKERKAKFNIVDIIILLALIGIIVASFVRADTVRNLVETDDKTIVYTYEACDLKASSANYIAAGDKLYIKESGKYIGTITKFEVHDAATIVETADGKLVEGTIPGRIDIVVTVETEGQETDAGIFINNGLFIASGKELEVTTETLTYPMTINDVYVKTEVEENA